MLIYPYKTGSSSARALSEGTGARRIKHVGSKLRGSPNKVVVNWGSSDLPAEVQRCRVLNSADRVRAATNKLDCLRILTEGGVPCIPYTTERVNAQRWLEEGKAVVCRTVLRASSGRGIVLADTVDELVNAPLYTKYIKKESEWRVHVLPGGVLDIQRKVRDNRVPDDQVNWRLRNHDQGFIFQRHGLNPPVQVTDVATRAISALGLDFGAVDVIFNRRDDAAYVLEVNCAPGLEGTTLERYVAAFRAAV